MDKNNVEDVIVEEKNPVVEEETTKFRVKVEQKTEKVKKFASAQNANVHLQLRKAKKYSLLALHKVVSLITPADKK